MSITRTDLEQEVAAVGGLSREELVGRWMRIHGCPPPKGIGRGLLERSAAWHLQAKRLGGLSPAARRALRANSRAETSRLGRSTAAAAESATSDSTTMQSGSANLENGRREKAMGAALPSLPLRRGTRLMREWNGRMHVVEVTDQGLIFDGKAFRSLSAIARRITGVRWSGPRFFGLPS